MRDARRDPGAKPLPGHGRALRLAGGPQVARRARERAQTLVATGLAPDPREAPDQPAAVEVLRDAAPDHRPQRAMTLHREAARPRGRAAQDQESPRPAAPLAREREPAPRLSDTAAHMLGERIRSPARSSQPRGLAARRRGGHEGFQLEQGRGLLVARHAFLRIVARDPRVLRRILATVRSAQHESTTTTRPPPAAPAAPFSYGAGHVHLTATS